MQTFTTSARGAFKTVTTAGVLALTVAGATVATAEPAAAHPRRGGAFHHGGFAHGGFGHGGFGHGGFYHVGGRRGGFAYGAGRAFGGYGFRHRAAGFRPFGFRRFAYGVGVPFGGYGLRRCGTARHFVPGLGCRLDVGYRAVPRFVGTRIGSRPFAIGFRRAVRPSGLHRLAGYGFGRFAYGPGRDFGGYRHGFHLAGFHHAGFHHAGFRPGGFHRG